MKKVRMSDAPEICQNCRKDIPLTNYKMHVIHCQRYVQLCSKCDEPVPRWELENHDVEYHSDIKCNKCHRKLESSELNHHNENDCPKRIQPCQYCNLELKADEMLAHEDYCGSRTECCEECGKLVMYKCQQIHLTSDHKLISPNENPSSESDDNSDVVDVEEHYSRLTRDDRLNPPSSRRGYNFRESERNNRFGEDLDEYFQNMELDRIRYSSTTKINQLTRTETSFHSNFTEEDQTCLPCEFCNHPFPACDLIRHQTGCRPDLSSLPNTYTEQSAEIENGVNVTCENSTQNLVFIPCQFCNESFSVENISDHQKNCESNVQFNFPSVSGY